MFVRHRYLAAFVFALIIHLLFFGPIFFYPQPKEKFVHENKKVLNLSQFETPKQTSKKSPPPQKEIKQKPKDQPKTKPTPHKMQEHADLKPIKKELNTTIAKPVEQRPRPKLDSTLSAINEAFKTSKPIEARGPIKQLYGDEFESMTDLQKKFIVDNLGSIGRITEKYLRFPEAAGRLNMQGRSVVEFLLHPNGDISDMRLLDSSGYRVLDRNSLETIEVAYKDYPRPSQTTKIRIYVHYQLY